MNKKSNKIVVEETKNILLLHKEKFLDIKNPKEVDLSKQIEQALQQTDDDKLREECERLYNTLNDFDKLSSESLETYLSKADIAGPTIRKYINIFLDCWYDEDEYEVEEIEKMRQDISQHIKEWEGVFELREESREEIRKAREESKKEIEEKDKEINKLLEEKDKLKEFEKVLKEKREKERTLREKEKILREEVERLKKQQEDAESTPSTPMTPGFPKDNEREEVTAQEWLEKIYGEDKEYVDEIDANKSNEKPTGELVIANYPILETINLKNMGITKLTVEECPNVEEITVHNNEITEIVGLENLAELKTLVCGSNQITKLDVSNNSQLVELTVFDNPNIQIVGLDSISKLEEFNGGGNNVLNLSQVSKESLEQAAKKLGIKEEKLKNKSSAEIKKLIEEEGNKIRINKEKLNDKTAGFPGLLSKNGEVVDDKLVEIKKEVESIKKLKKEIKEVKKQIIIREVQIGEIEKELESKMGMDRLNNLKNKVQKKMQKKIEILEAKMQASNK